MIYAGSVEGIFLKRPALMEVMVTEDQKKLSVCTGFSLFVEAVFPLQGPFPAESEFSSLT